MSGTCTRCGAALVAARLKLSRTHGMLTDICPNGCGRVSRAAPPQRRFTLSVQIGGDDWPTVLAHLREIADHIEEHGPACNRISGGPGAGHTVRVTEDPTMDHDRYHAELKAYLAATRTVP